MRGQIVRNAVAKTAPELLDITTDADSAVADLNSWIRTCRAEAPDTSAATRGIPAALLSEGMRSRIEGDYFDNRDGMHLRDCAWLWSVVDTNLSRRGSDLDWAMTLFYYVIRNVMLIADEEVKAPFSVEDLCTQRDAFPFTFVGESILYFII